MDQRHNILVVDDEPQVIKSMQHLLRLEYNVLGATRAADALKILEQQPVDVVMTDQRMPEVNGVELLSRVHERYPDITRLLVTGYADVKAVIDSINKGHVYRYVSKPWDPDELDAILRGACDHHDLIVERKRLIKELQDKNALLEQADQLKTAFIKVASHEFRTPVTILSGLCKLAVLDEPRTVDSLMEHLSHIDDAVVRLQRLVDQTISMLSTERFNDVFHRRPQDLAPLLQLAAADVKPFIELRHQNFQIELAPDLGSIEIDAEKIRDSVNHLLLNAIKFTPDGGAITLRAYRQDGQIEIEVADTGSGIAPQWLPRMFEPFFTGFDVSRHSSGQYEFGARGLGLGLSVVRAFVQMHGGNATLKSEPGRGSTFRVELPLNQDNPASSEAAKTLEQVK